MELHRDVATNGLKSHAVLFADRPCGTRQRYMAGCRCSLCRKANSNYENERQKARRRGDWNGIVSADSACAHMKRLSYQGIGRKAVGAATDIADSILHQVASGTRKFIRARTERKILAVTVDCISDGALKPAKKTWKLLDQLIAEGYRKGYLARALGFKGLGIQVGRKYVLVRTEQKVMRLHKRLHGNTAALDAQMSVRERIRRHPKVIVHRLHDKDES